MKKIAYLLAVTIFIFTFQAGCSNSKAPKPSETVKRYYDLLSKKQFSKAYDLILPGNPPVITKEEYINELKKLDKKFSLKEVKVVNEEIKGDQAEVTVEITELDKQQGFIVTSQAKISLKLIDSKWYLIWPKKGKEDRSDKN